MDGSDKKAILNCGRLVLIIRVFTLLLRVKNSW